jgi:cytochrome c oxidase subunit II
MYSGASTFVEGVDNAFVFIIGISLFFLVGITAVIILFIYRYNRKKHPKAIQNEGSTKLEIIWTVIPIILVLGMFYYGYVGWIPMKKPPEKGVNVTANARMWSFSFQYENGRISDKLYVPVDTAVIVRLNALDVLHSFYIPAFRIKEDMVPGLPNNRSWFEATKTGTYNVFCSEYCGLQHSLMYSEVVVMEQDEFWEWYQDTTAVEMAVPEDADPAMLGRQIVETKGCLACHSLDGRSIIGPTFLERFGTTVSVVTDGEERELLYDEEYVQRSIYEPDYDLSKGFRKGQMISYRGEISEEEVGFIIEFLKSLSN